jgi:hypothetical protein
MIDKSKSLSTLLWVLIAALAIALLSVLIGCSTVHCKAYPTYDQVQGRLNTIKK